MTPSARCPDCGEPMEEGWTTDANFASFTQTCWHRDPPEVETRLGSPVGTKATRAKMVPITSFRCPKCGLLKSYALPKAPRK